MNAPESVFARVAAASSWTRWTPEEEALLREHYPKGGGERAASYLTGRTLRAVFARAHRLGLETRRSPPPGRGPGNRRWETSEAIDAAIRRTWQEPPTRTAVRKLCAAIMRPHSWVTKRAVTLGLVVPRFAPRAWSKEEDAYLEAHAHVACHTLAARFRERGWDRTASAIEQRVKHRKLDIVDPERYNARQLAGLMGVNEHTVRHWIEHEGLASDREPMRTGDPGARKVHWIARRDLRRWIGTHAQLVDLRKVDRYWFIDLAFGPK